MSHDDYVVDCCGVVDEWKVKYAGVSGTRTIYFQLWRQTTADVYELVGQNSESVSKYSFGYFLISSLVSRSCTRFQHQKLMMNKKPSKTLSTEVC